MSLFPAYTPSTSKQLNETENHGGKVQAEDTKGTLVNDLPWLKNTSYPSLQTRERYCDEKKDCDGEKNEDEHPKHHDKHLSTKTTHKKKKKKEKKREVSRHRRAHSGKQAEIPKIVENYQFYEDKKQERGNFLVDTLHRPAIPRYNKHNRFFRKYSYFMKKYKKKNKISRYFLVATLNKNEVLELNNCDTSSKEEELTKVTENLNKRLSENPHDVDTWLEYVNFQDTVYEFEKTYRKNPSGGNRVTCERKLAILERAIQNNPACERLLAEKLELSEGLKSADLLAEECLHTLTQDPGNLVVWRALVRTSRNSMARCTVPGVLLLFSKAISRISQLRLHRSPVTVEQDILSLLLECGLFLQQAGLFEQLWTLLQMYLGLSLTASGHFNVPFQVQEEKLREQEDRVMASGLPISELWLRVEKLRAATHFLPDCDCDSDPQRVVFSDDMSGLLQPVMSPESHLRLVVISALLLKVPLLPTRHTLLNLLGLLDIPSAFNNAEVLLAAFYPTGIPTSSRSCLYLSEVRELISEPSYVRENQQYLSWVTSVLQLCAELLPPAEAVIVHSWRLRLYSVLCRLNTGSTGSSSLLSSVSKQAKAQAKLLLKQPQLRDNLILYSEYALLERDAGDLAKACRVLEIAAASPKSFDVDREVSQTLLCRRLVECLLAQDSLAEKDHALRVLIAFLNRQPISNNAVSEVTIKQSLAKWQKESIELADRWIPLAGQSLTLVVAMTPQLLVEWLCCHALLLSLTHSVWEATALLQKHIDLIPHTPNTLGSLWVEQLYEKLADLLYRHTVNSHTNFALLRNSVVKALMLFPNNMCLLDTLATIETGSGGGGTLLWKMISYFPASAPLARLVLVFVVRHRVSSFTTEDGTAGTGGMNYLRNLFCQLIKEKKTSQCPLIWRLYLQLVAATDSPSRVKEIFYTCLQTCPWAKDFYLDAVTFLPEELSEVQDLMIEKELRLHTTPEELEILRE